MNYNSACYQIRYQEPSLPVVFNATIDGNVTVREVEKNEKKFKRAIFTLNFFGKPVKKISGIGTIETSDKAFKVPAVASYEAAEVVSTMKKGDQLTGAGYAYNNKGKVWLIIQALARVSGDKPETLYKSTLSPIYIKNSTETPVFLVGSYQNKYQRDVKEGKGCSASVSLYHKSETIKKLCGQDVFLSGNDDYTNLSVIGFGYQADAMRAMEFSEDMIAGGTLSTHDYKGKKYVSFFASVILSPRNKKNNDSVAEQNEDNGGSITADTSSSATAESTSDTESGELSPEEELDLLL